MIALAFRFPGGRYHATPWGHQVNEGLVEWPPSPWRLLRAMISCGFTRLAWSEVPDVAKRLLGKLASSLPEYHLPAATTAHSRHYMPLQTGKTTLVLDPWLNVAGDLQVQWALELEPDERQMLADIASNMGYLGRSESWVEGRILEEKNPLPINCRPYRSDEPRDPSREELVSILAAIPQEEYSLWRAGKIPALGTEVKKPSPAQLKAHRKLEAPFPADVLDSLQWDTARWKSFGWNLPPGSQWVRYRRPKAIVSSLAPRDPMENNEKIADLVLLALATPSGNRSALPRISRTLPQAELIHRSLVSQADQGQGSPEVLTGRSEDGRPLEGHQHTHILPLDADQDGHLDHVLLWAPSGFIPKALAAIRRVRKTWTKGGGSDLLVASAGHGFRDQLEELPHLECVLGRSATWRSVTPFVPPRYMKTRGANSLEGQIRSELAARTLPHALDEVGITVRLAPDSEDLPATQRSQFRHFVRRRARGGVAPPMDVGFFVVLRFATQISGPLALGYGSHFGLGRFESDPSSDELVDLSEHPQQHAWAEAQTPGSWLKGLRESHEWSRETLAERLGGVSISIIADWEADSLAIEPIMADKLAGLLRIPAIKFLPLNSPHL